MAWKHTNPMEQKIAFITQAQRVSAGRMAALCRQFGISRKSGYKWLKRYRQAGSLTALEEHSRRPHRSPRRTPEALTKRILELRAPDGWGARKIAHLLWPEGWRVSKATVHRVLLRHGEVHRLDQHTPAPARFERSQPNELFQADFKGPMGHYGVKDEPLSILDDHSRYGVGLYALPDHSCQRVQDCFIDVFERCGKPHQLLLDHGTPWWNNQNGWGLSRLSVFLIEQDIDLIFSRIAHPQTQGKVERFHRTLSRSMIRQGFPRQWEEWQERYDRFLERYNQVRPHESLGMQTPAQRYRPSQREYHSRVVPWHYPANLQPLWVDAKGMIRWSKRRYFVCEALVNRQVVIEQIGAELLVRFRNMYIRRIDLQTHRTAAFTHRISDDSHLLPMS
jgi:transposase InsO family protein